MSIEASRTPPAEVRRILRQEVNFGCPICGSPFLTWHHFNPAWHVKPHHKPKGMIALCLQHHKEADVGTYTIKQLQELKSHPYLEKATLRAKFNWQREKVLLQVGSNYYISPEHILRLGNYNIISISHDSMGLKTISLDLRKENGNPILRMEANDWILLDQVDDIQCPPSANSLTLSIASEGIFLNLRFRSFSLSRLRNKIKKQCSNFIWEAICPLISEWPVTLCTIDGKFVWPVKCKLNTNGTTSLLMKSKIKCCFKAGGGLTIHEDGSMTF